MIIREILEKDWHTIMQIQVESYFVIEPEPLSVLKSKWILSPETCLVSEENQNIIGYCLAHPWEDNSAPALNLEVKRISADASGIFIHDLAVAPNSRRCGVGKEIYFCLLSYALQNKFKYLSLVAIQNTQYFWERFGFKSTKIEKPLLSYGANSMYMKLELKNRII
jgi:ribosomal protein S18 acetylase RimI-like enzyme